MVITTPGSKWTECNPIQSVMVRSYFEAKQASINPFDQALCV